MPLKMYYSMETENKKFADQSKVDSLKIAKLTNVNGEQLMKLMSLSEDSLKMHYSFDSLLILHEKQSHLGFIQIANIKRALENKNSEVTHVEQKSQSIIYSFKSFDIESNSIYRQLKRLVQQYNNQGILVSKSYWDVSINLPNDLIFKNNNIDSLSAKGMNIIESIVSIVKQYPKYHIDITEYSKPYTKSFITQKIKTKIIKDTLQHATIDSTGVNKTIDIGYSYTGFDITDDKITIKYPLGMHKGTPIINYIEMISNHNEISYSGSIITNKPASLDSIAYEKIINIIITPKTTSILRDIGSF